MWFGRKKNHDVETTLCSELPLSTNHVPFWNLCTAVLVIFVMGLASRWNMVIPMMDYGLTWFQSHEMHACTWWCSTSIPIAWEGLDHGNHWCPVARVLYIDAVHVLHSMEACLQPYRRHAHHTLVYLLNCILMQYKKDNSKYWPKFTTSKPLTTMIFLLTFVHYYSINILIDQTDVFKTYLQCLGRLNSC